MTNISFEIARDWLFQQEPQSTAIIDRRESRHPDGQRYVSHELTILRKTLSDSVYAYGHQSWAEAKAAMEAKLQQTTGGES